MGSSITPKKYRTFTEQFPIKFQPNTQTVWHHPGDHLATIGRSQTNPYQIPIK